MSKPRCDHGENGAQELFLDYFVGPPKWFRPRLRRLIGRDLITVKDRLGHGRFLPWIESELGMKERTVSSLVRGCRAQIWRRRRTAQRRAVVTTGDVLA